jgi:hypothetical protein
MSTGGGYKDGLCELAGGGGLHRAQSLTVSVFAPRSSAAVGGTLLCVDPVETAADKLSALAWRVCVRERGAPNDDPTIIRHLHDLAALESRAATALAFLTLLARTASADTVEHALSTLRAELEKASRSDRLAESTDAPVRVAEAHEQPVLLHHDPRRMQDRKHDEASRCRHSHEQWIADLPPK